MIGHHKLVLLIWINDIDALVSFEKQFFLPFLSFKVHLLIRSEIDSHNISFLLNIGHHKLIRLIRIKDIDALVS